MRILQLCNKIPYPPKDGSSLASWNMALGLARADHKVDIISLNTSKHYIKDPALPEGERNNMSLTGLYHNTSSSPYGLLRNLLLSKKPYNIERFDSSKMSQLITDRLRQENYDMVILEGLPLALYSGLIRKHSNARLIMRSHNVEYQLWEGRRDEERNPLKRLYYSILSRRLKNYEIKETAACDALVCISNEDSEFFSDHFPARRIFTLPFSLDPERYLTKAGQENSGEDIRNIMFLGALDWEPNIAGLKWFTDDVWPLVHKEHPASQLHIAGRNPYPALDYLKELEGVIFHGEIEDPGDYLSMGNIMIVPLFSGSGMRVKIIEGMARGKLIIATTKAASGIPAENGSELFIEDRPEAFASRINHILDSKHNTKAIREAALSFVNKKYNIFEQTKALLEFFNSLEV